MRFDIPAHGVVLLIVATTVVKRSHAKESRIRFLPKYINSVLFPAPGDFRAVVCSCQPAFITLDNFCQYFGECCRKWIKNPRYSLHLPNIGGDLNTLR